MHYVGINALQIPRGYVKFDVLLVMVSAVTSGLVWSRLPPSDLRGYLPPPNSHRCSWQYRNLTCIFANVLLAHTVTSRNKLAEIIWTRQKLWRMIAQKENAEAAAARSDFIASASHEI